MSVEFLALFLGWLQGVLLGWWLWRRPQLKCKHKEQEPELVGVIGNWGRVEWADGVYPQMGDRLYSAPPSKQEEK